MTKRTIFPFIFNDQLTYKLARATVVSLLGITVFCGGIIGCDNGNNPVTDTETAEVPAETEVVETTVQVISDYDGDSILFVEAGTYHEARVLEGVSADEVRVTGGDGWEKVIPVDRIQGTLIPDHPDLDIKFVDIYIDVDEVGDVGRVKIFDGKIHGADHIDKIVPFNFGDVKAFGCRGVISAVYSDGMSKISVWGFWGEGREWFHPDPAYIHFARQVQPEELLAGKVKAIIGKWMTDEQSEAWRKVMGWW